jgi:hypothetical protein
VGKEDRGIGIEGAHRDRHRNRYLRVAGSEIFDLALLVPKDGASFLIG